MQVARIVSNFPIVASASACLLAGRFQVQRSTWDEYDDGLLAGTGLILLDVTSVSADRVVALLARVPFEMRVLIMSLDRNEVDMYQVGPNGLTARGELSSLVALASMVATEVPSEA